MRIDTICALGVLVATVFFICVASYQFFFTWRALVGSKSAEELFLAISRTKTCAALYFAASVVLLACFSGIKALLLLKGLLVDASATLTAFGRTTGGDLAGHLGLCGFIVLGTGVYAAFRYLKATHYLQILFTFRTQLGLQSQFPANERGRPPSPTEKRTE